METGKILSTKNIPDEMLVGFGKGMTVLECANKNVYEKVEKDFRGAIFHKEKNGRFFVALSNSYVKMLEKLIER